MHGATPAMRPFAGASRSSDLHENGRLGGHEGADDLPDQGQRPWGFIHAARQATSRGSPNGGDHEPGQHQDAEVMALRCLGGVPPG